MSKNIGAILGSVVTLIVLLYLVINVPRWIEPTGLIIEPVWIFLICVVIAVAILAGLISLFR